MIGILNYRMGNLRSVQKALEHLGHDAQVVGDAGEVERCGRLILPGVGNFADGMAQLGRLGLVDPVKAFAASGRPMLGICLGMQLMFDSSTEDAPADAPTPGLGLIPGTVVRFQEDQGPGQPRLKVPHMGWNALEYAGSSGVEVSGNVAEKASGGDPSDSSGGGGVPPLFAGLTGEPGGERGSGGAYVYFVHGYYCVPEDAGDVAARTHYGQPFCSAVHRGHLWATQFHPEKSQRVGLQILDNFAGCVA